MKQQIFILLAALQLSYQEHESPSVHTPDEVIQEHYKRLSPGCKTEIKLQMEQICKVHDRFKFTPSYGGCFVYCYNNENDGMRVTLRNGLPCGENGQICKNGKCVSTPNNCEIDYFFP
uniref:Putative secreted protein n=1 Tax=Ixodes scapularis TaxID=6945 RepID=Q4PNB3_IXOSC|nr:putative secreted protein [Ixodes scapularis]